MRKILLKPLRDIKEVKWRSVASIFIVMLGVISYSGVTIARDTVVFTLESIYSETNFADLMLELDFGDESIIKHAENLYNVKEVEGRLVIDGAISLDERSIVAKLVGIKADDRPKVNDVIVLKGRYLDVNDPFGVLIEEKLASVYGYDVWDTIEVVIMGGKHEFRVIGIVASPEYLAVTASPQFIIPLKGSMGVLFVPLETLQRITGNEGRLNNIALTFVDDSPEYQEYTEDQIRKGFSEHGITAFIPRRDQYSFKYLDTAADIFNNFRNTFAGIFLIVAFAVILTTMNKLVVMQRREIGVLRALGYARREVMGSYLLTSFIYGCGGSILGILPAIGFGYFYARQWASSVGVPFVEMSLTPAPFMFGAAVGVFTALAASLVPVWSVVKLRPREAIHFGGEMDLRVSGVPVVERLLSRVAPMPVAARYGLRNLFRRKRRTFLTMMGITLAIGISGTWVIMTNAAFYMIDDVVGEEKWDIAVAFTALLPQSFLGDVEVAGVEEVEPYLRGFAEYSVYGEEETYPVIGMREDTMMRHFTLLEGGYFTGGDEIIVSKNLASKLGLDVFDKVTLTTSLNELEVTVVGISRETQKNGYVSLSTAGRLFGENMMSGAYMIATSPMEIAGIEEELYDRGYVANVMAIGGLRRGMQEMIAQMGVINYFGLFLGIVMALIFIFSNISMEILERESEYSILRSMGYGKKEVAQMISVEILSQGLLAVALGIPLGIVIAQGIWSNLIGLFDIHGYGIQWGWEDMVIVAVPALVAILAATIPPIRHIYGINIAEAARKRMIA